MESARATPMMADKRVTNAVTTIMMIAVELASLVLLSALLLARAI
jgi:hypothetical protein